ncbi:FMN-binding negative transcriptional regulator [Sphingomonas sp.]|uniref:FMN-binding negative transcriptional regulator n=1 Tax=Sphingomonas sp. TaxID=28214 RepID=UPI0031DD0EBB
MVLAKWAQPLSPFEHYDDADLRMLVDEHPLAWVTARGGEGLEASLLPLIGVYDGTGRLVELIGHLARSNPLHAALARDPAATILFRGPEGYVSPEQAGRRDWAPTWNYAQARINAEITFDAALTEESLAVLTSAMERVRPDPWSSGELGERYARMLGAIIGFRARPIAVAAKFKLGQDERADTLRAILATMADPALKRWMMHFNRSRF